jgi:hypothetical protein
MHDRARIRNTFVGLTAALLVPVVSVPAAADIYRGCVGLIEVTVVGLSGTDGSGATTMILDDFEGRGQCNNTAQANTCRVRAKDNVFRCANDLWAARWTLIGDPNDSNPDGGIPLSCQDAPRAPRAWVPSARTHSASSSISSTRSSTPHAAKCGPRRALSTSVSASTRSGTQDVGTNGEHWKATTSLTASDSAPKACARFAQTDRHGDSVIEKARSSERLVPTHHVPGRLSRSRR